MHRAETWVEDESAKLGTAIRLGMSQFSKIREQPVKKADVGSLIERRIEQAYQRGLRAARANKKLISDKG